MWWFLLKNNLWNLTFFNFIVLFFLAPCRWIWRHYCDGAVVCKLSQCVPQTPQTHTHTHIYNTYIWFAFGFFFLNLWTLMYIHVTMHKVIYANPWMWRHGVLCGQQNMNKTYMIICKQVWMRQTCLIGWMWRSNRFENNNCTNNIFFLFTI